MRCTWAHISLNSNPNSPMMDATMFPTCLQRTKIHIAFILPEYMWFIWCSFHYHWSSIDPKFKKRSMPPFYLKATWPTDAVRRPAFVQPWPLVDTAQLPLRWSALCGMSIVRKKRNWSGLVPWQGSKVSLEWNICLYGFTWFYNDGLDGDG